MSARRAHRLRYRARYATCNVAGISSYVRPFISMATSSGEYLSRNIEFLYSKNRFNVAVSRARSLAVLVASPKLLEVNCATPEQMALVDTLCWFVAAAGPLLDS